MIAAMTKSSRRVRDLLESFQPIAKDARVIEVGSGAHGLIFCFGAERGVGVDPLAVDYGGLFPGWQCRASTVAAIGESLPFRDQSFDVVICDNVVDHAESPAQIVSELGAHSRARRPAVFHREFPSSALQRRGGHAFELASVGLAVRDRSVCRSHHASHTATSASELFRNLPLKS